MSGLSVGILSGLVVATVGVAAVSLSTPLPPRDGEMAVMEPDVEVMEPEAAEAMAAGDGAEDAPTPDEGSALEEAPADAAAAPTDAPEALSGASLEGDEADAGAAAGEGEDPSATPDGDEADATPAVEDPETIQGPATEIPLPAGTEFNRPAPEPEAALPSAETAPSASAPLAPALAGDVAAPTFDTSSAALPNVGADAPAALSLSADPSAAPASPAAVAAPLTTTGPATLTQPDASASPDVNTAALAPVEDEAPVEEDAPAEEEAAAAVEQDPVAEPVEEVTALAVPEASADPVVQPLQTPVFPTIGDGTSAEGFGLPQTPAAPTEEVAGLNTPLFPQTSGLPQLGGEAAVEDEAEPVAPEVDAAPLPAIQAFAAEFDASETRPLMAVVLIDEPDSRIEQSTLTRFTFPVAFAVDPLHPDAAARAAAYREAGFEVVILGSMIAEGATAADVEVALAAAESVLPESVAVLDTPEDRIQADRPVLDAVVGVLAETGHGLVAFPRGLNAAEQSANRAGVAGATVFRMLDDDDQPATVITRLLGRAAFTATQEGAVIVVGRTRPDTVTALFSWALGGRSEGVALAPLSATIERAAGQ